MARRITIITQISTLYSTKNTTNTLWIRLTIKGSVYLYDIELNRKSEQGETASPVDPGMQ